MATPPTYSIRFRPRPARALRRLPAQVQIRIEAIIDALSRDPRPVGCKQLIGSSGLYRVRSGDYRVIYEIRDRELVIIVIDLGHRREVYRHR